MRVAVGYFHRFGLTGAHRKDLGTSTSGLRVLDSLRWQQEVPSYVAHIGTQWIVGRRNVEGLRCLTDNVAIGFAPLWKGQTRRGQIVCTRNNLCQWLRMVSE